MSTSQRSYASRPGASRVVTMRRRYRWRTPGWAELLRLETRKLVELFDTITTPTFLVGGLGVGVRQPEFYRNHADIDIAVFVDDLDSFRQYLTGVGFELLHWRFGVPVTPLHRVDIAARLPLELDPAALSTIRFRASRCGAAARIRFAEHRLDYFDVLLLEPMSDGIEMLGYGVTVPEGDFYPCQSLAGSRLLLPNLAYKQHLGAGWWRQRRDLRQFATVG